MAIVTALLPAKNRASQDKTACESVSTCLQQISRMHSVVYSLWVRPARFGGGFNGTESSYCRTKPRISLIRRLYWAHSLDPYLLVKGLQCLLRKAAFLGRRSLFHFSSPHADLLRSSGVM